VMGEKGWVMTYTSMVSFWVKFYEHNIWGSITKKAEPK